MQRSLRPFCALLVVLFATASAAAGDGGAAVVRIVAEPAISAGSSRFAGTPAGTLQATPDRDSLAASDLAAGLYKSTLEAMDPNAVAAGYRLVEIRCDDPASSGDVASRTARFKIDPGKTVTCTFMLAAGGACICPKEGIWNANNLPGQMACTGAMTMTLPLAPSSMSGTFKIENGCETVVAAGFSEDEAPLVMHRNSNCGYQGSVGGEQDGIPMTIDFVWSVTSDEAIVGSLHSEVSQQGMTCVMSRDFELDFAQ